MDHLMDATLNEADSYVIRAPRDGTLLPDALRGLLPSHFVVALEATRFDSEVEQSLKPFTVVPILMIRAGTGWPKSHWLHFEARGDALRVFEDLIRRIERPVLCNHLYAYSERDLLVQWHDAFTTDPIRVSRLLPLSLVTAFCVALAVEPPSNTR